MSFAACRTIRSAFAPPRALPDAVGYADPKELPEEVRRLEKARDAAPERFDVRFALGYRYLRLAIAGFTGLTNKAIAELEAAVKLEPKHDQAVGDLVQAYMLGMTRNDEEATLKCAAMSEHVKQMDPAPWRETTRVSAALCKVVYEGAFDNDPFDFKDRLAELEEEAAEGLAFPHPLAQDGTSIIVGPLFAELPPLLYEGARARALHWYERMERSAVEDGFADPGFKDLAPLFAEAIVLNQADLLRILGRRDRAQERYEEVVLMTAKAPKGSPRDIFRGWALDGLKRLDEKPDRAEVPHATRGELHCLQCHWKTPEEALAPATGKFTPPLPDDLPPL
ncbi:MAG: hypothetical protein ACK4N5_05060 [Myxococcales bacterium]